MDKERRNRGNKIYYSRNDLLTLNKNGRSKERKRANEERKRKEMDIERRNSKNKIYYYSNDL